MRNLQPLTLEPSERFNVFVGDNGQGKTNLLEAIYAVAALRSFRTTRLADLVAFGQAEARLGARVVRDDMVRVYELELAPGARRVRLDGKPVRPVSKYFGGFNIVVFTPEDLALPRGSPGDRRRFLDRVVFNVRGDYLAVAQDYDKVLKQRNSVLRQAAEGAPRTRIDELLSVYDTQLARTGVEVTQARSRVVAELGPELESAFTAITHTTHRVSARYASEVAGMTAAELEARLGQERSRDLAAGTTRVGPHRDDLVFEHDGRDAGTFASQGQLRATMLAWKTAELALLERVHGDAPILLLDDVSSELDEARNAYLFEHLARRAGQCFITTTHERHVLVTSERADFHVQNGRISP